MIDVVARVRAVLSQSDFRKWLHLANDELDGQRHTFEVAKREFPEHVSRRDRRRL
jgi:hypothetical protein